MSTGLFLKNAGNAFYSMIGSLLIHQFLLFFCFPWFPRWLIIIFFAGIPLLIDFIQIDLSFILYFQSQFFFVSVSSSQKICIIIRKSIVRARRQSFVFRDHHPSSGSSPSTQEMFITDLNKKS